MTAGVMVMPQRWTAKKKAEIVLEIIKGKLKLVDFCRQNDLKQSEVESWMDDFVKSGTMGLKTNPKQAKDEFSRKEKQLHQIIGEQALEIKILKKSIELQELEENE